MTQLWTIARTSDGAVLAASFETPSFGVHPKDRGWAWDSATQKATRIDKRPDPGSQLWSGTAWVDDLAKLKVRLVTQVKLENETFVRALYTTNFGKQKKYSRKQQEVMDYRALAPVTLSLAQALNTSLGSLLPQFVSLGAAAQKKKFRFAMAEAALRGVTVDVVIGEYEAAIETIESKVAAYEAVELVTVRAINAATTTTAANAAYAARNWSWTA
jgi:hypothetical protein